MGKTENDIDQKLTEAEKHKVQENARELADLLSIWASCYPIIRARRAAPVAVLIETVLPNFELDVSLLVGKLILFIFAVDDLADERLLSYLDFRRASKAWEEIARYGQTSMQVEQDGNLSAVISEIRSAFVEYSIFPNLVDLWANRLRLLCEAMAKEYLYGLRYKASGGESLPSLDEYIEGGIHSVGFPFWGTSVLILLSESAILNHLDKIDEMILQTGAAIRLYNDVRTYDKEVQEDNINAITILQSFLPDEQLAPPAADRFQQVQETVMKLANQFAEKSCELSGQVQTNTGQFEIMIRRIIAFHADFYGSRQHNRDYHTISASDSFSMI